MTIATPGATCRLAAYSTLGIASRRIATGWASEASSVCARQLSTEQPADHSDGCDKHALGEVARTAASRRIIPCRIVWVTEPKRNAGASPALHGSAGRHRRIQTSLLTAAISGDLDRLPELAAVDDL